MKVIGLTGGIASGKSTVSQMLSELGAVVIDADKIGHEAFRPDTDAWRQVVAEFGRGILDRDGEIDRSRLADVVFNDPRALEKLNRIMHPRMRRIVEGRIEALRGQGVEAVVLEAALLIEAKWTDLVDQVWVAVAPESQVIDRLRSQRGFNEERGRARIESQMSADERARHADVLIVNDADMDTLREKVRELWENLPSQDNR